MLRISSMFPSLRSLPVNSTFYLRNKYLISDEDKKNLTQAVIVDKVPKKYVLSNIGFSFKQLNSIGIVLVDFQIISLSVMVLIKEQNLALLSFLPQKRKILYVNAEEAKISHSVMELIKLSSCEFDP